MSRTPTIQDVIKTAIDSRLKQVHVSIPARVERYDSSKQLIDAQPLIKVSYETEDGVKKVEQLPVIANVPVVFPGAGSYRFTFPVTVGDTVLLIFSEAALDKWLNQGGLVDPIDTETRFNLSDGIAVPGLRDFAHPLADAPTDKMTIGIDDGLQIHLDGSTIKLGGDGATESAVLGNVLKSAFDTFKTSVDTLMGAYSTGDASAPLTHTLLVGVLTTALHVLVGAIDGALSNTVKIKP